MVDRETAYCYAEIRRELKGAGQPIPSNDLWIAALAREYGLPVVSRDSHFRAVRGLRVQFYRPRPPCRSTIPPVAPVNFPSSISTAPLTIT